MKNNNQASSPQPFLETKRLKLIPLFPDQLLMLRDDPKTLYHSLALVYDDAPIKQEVLQLIGQQHSKMLADPNFMSFHTLWIITLLEEKRVIGIVYFDGPATQTGMVTLKGSLHKNYRGHSYMREAYDIIRKWAFSKKEVIMMLAYADEDDERCLNMLRKLGFSRWLEHERPDGPQLWCCEKPIRSSAKIGILIGFALGIALGLLFKFSLWIPALLCGLLGFAICIYHDGKERRKHLLLLNEELSHYKRPEEVPEKAGAEKG